MNNDFWRNKRVFLTGHTGFKGSWLSLWLTKMGAIVSGFSLPPPTEPNLFSSAKVGSEINKSTLGDIRDIDALVLSMESSRPEIVFHLAAQSLVRYSYAQPLETFDTNIMGTICLFEAIRKMSGIRAVINVTTDKCYQNFEREKPYAEGEILGGDDPYSSSKACSELVTVAYRHSFLNSRGTFVASARAGNVIGGGDWAENRLLPDFFRANNKREILHVRSPNSIRPWQHVLEPLAGYLMLAERLYLGGESFAGAWNFGPKFTDAKTVNWVIKYLNKKIPSAKWQEINTSNDLRESKILKLDSQKAEKFLGWSSQWDIKLALDKTIEWYQLWDENSSMMEITLNQINDYEETISL